MKSIAFALAAVLGATGIANAGAVGDFAGQLQYPTFQSTDSGLDHRSTGSIKRPRGDERRSEQADQR